MRAAFYRNYLHLCAGVLSVLVVPLMVMQQSNKIRFLIFQEEMPKIKIKRTYLKLRLY